MLAFLVITESRASLVCCLEREAVYGGDKSVECQQGWPFTVHEESVTFTCLWSVNFKGKYILDQPNGGLSLSVNDALLILEEGRDEYVRFAYGAAFQEFENAMENG